MNKIERQVAHIGKCTNCNYESLRWFPKDYPCSKCGGLVKILAEEVRKGGTK
jgi:rRNA maturation endonuclease Nob1